MAVYGGEPAWHEFDIRTNTNSVRPEDLSDTARYSVGYLSLTEQDQLYALDGQHRVAGLKQAVESQPDLGLEELSVIIVAHHNNEAGLRRTRKLFTTLNKSAKPVKKSEIIALDEADVMAIATRHLVETHPYFCRGQVDILKKQANLHAQNTSHFTTIINLYDTLSIVFPYVMKRMEPEERDRLRVYRPSDERVAEFNSFAVTYYEQLARTFPDLEEYFTAAEPEKVLARKRRGSENHLLFRPVGLTILAQVLRTLRAKHSFNDAIRLVGRLPMRLAEAPYSGVLWNSHNGTIATKRAALCRDLLLYMLGHYKARDELRSRYAAALEIDPTETTFPELVL